MKFKKIGNVDINGERWEFGWGDCGMTPNGPAIGKCYYQNRRITINKKYHADCRLSDVVAHEVLHAYIPFANEDFVERFGNTVGDMEKKLSKSIEQERNTHDS